MNQMNKIKTQMQLDVLYKEEADQRETDLGIDEDNEINVRFNWVHKNKINDKNYLYHPQKKDIQVFPDLKISGLKLQQEEEALEIGKEQKEQKQQKRQNESREQKIQKNQNEELIPKKQQQQQNNLQDKALKAQSCQKDFQKQQKAQVKEQTQKKTQKFQQILHEQRPKVLSNDLQSINSYSNQFKSKTITISQNMKQATQYSQYYDNFKIALTSDITSLNAQAKFRIQQLKYCVGFGVGVKQILQRHNFCYKSDGNQMSHGLYIVTTQGYSWSHSEKHEDDKFQETFNLLFPGACVDVTYSGQEILFKWKKGQFRLTIPSRIREKYTLAFCVYLHEKGDSVSLQ